MYDASSSINDITVSPELITVFPYENVSSTIKFSPSNKPKAKLSEPDSTYFMNKVNWSTSELSSGYKKLSIITTTPETSPLNLNPLSSFKYNEIGTPKWSFSTIIEKYSSSYAILPGITIEPSLNIWVPNDSIWFCKIDCKVLNSLAWTGNPGLNNTL